MTSYAIELRNQTDRERAKIVIDRAPRAALVTVKVSKRSLPQNSRMWAMLSEIAMQAEWHGRKFTPDVWKHILLSGFRKVLPAVVQNWDGTGLIPLGGTSDMSKAEMADFLTWIEAEAAPDLGVQFSCMEGGEA